MVTAAMFLVAAALHAVPTPQQLHVSFGNATDSMLIQWAVPSSKPKNLPTPQVRYGLISQPPAQWTAVEPQNTLTGPGPYLNYRALLTGLTPGAQYGYSCGWEGEAEAVTSHFTAAPRDDLSYSPRMVFFGDLGWTDNQILPLLAEECAAGAVDTIVMFGDFVYWDNGENENAFMRDISRASGNGSVPIMVTPGNGDYDSGTYIRYKTQWGMPNWETTDSLYHSFNSGRAHIVGINTEVIEYGVPYPQKKAEMLAWLEADMKQANAERAQRPWIIVHFHRPAYSTGGTDAIPYEVFEPLMYKYGVDVVFSGHVHNQERTLPVYNRTLVPSPNPAEPYADARAPVYIVSGSPGNAEERDDFGRGFDPWTGWRSYLFGYTHVTVHDEKTLAIDFMSTNLGGAIIDSFEVTKTKACNFGEMCDGTLTAVPAERTVSPSTVAAEALQREWARRNAPAEPIPAQQVAALKDLYTATNGNSWTRNDNWLNGKDPCDASTPWYGVSCVRVTERTLQNLWNGTVGVTAVQLPSNNLAGTIPEGLGGALAATIQLIDLSHNLIEGALPESLLRGLPLLHSLYVEPKTDDERNKLTGTLPADMGLATGLPNLRYLGLNRNALTGEIPGSWGQLPCRVETASGDNTKPDPTVAGQVACLLWVSGNNLTGPVPHGFCDGTYGQMSMGDNPGMQCPGGSPPCFNVLYGGLPKGCGGSCTKC